MSTLDESDTLSFLAPYLLTISISVLVFLLAIISAFGVIHCHAPQAPGGGNSRDDGDVHNDAQMVVDTPEKDQGLSSYSRDYIKVSLIIFYSNDANVEVVEGGYNAEDESTSVEEGYIISGKH